VFKAHLSLSSRLQRNTEDDAHARLIWSLVRQARGPGAGAYARPAPCLVHLARVCTCIVHPLLSSCAAIARRTRIQGEKTYISLSSRRERLEEEDIERNSEEDDIFLKPLAG